MDFEIEKTVCFTGHRHIDAESEGSVRLLVREALKIYIRRGYNTFIAGGAMGFDTIAAEEVIRLRSEGNAVRLILALPCRKQTEKWIDGEKVITYDRINGLADGIVYTSDCYFSGCMHTRNRFMVDNSSACIAYCKKSSGGSAYTCNYAEKKGLELVNLGAVATQLTIY